MHSTEIGSFNDPEVFIERQLSFYGLEERDPQKVSRGLKEAIMLPIKYDIPALIFDEDSIIKNNTMYSLYLESDCPDIESIQRLITSGFKKVLDSKVNDGLIHTFFYVIIKTERNPLPIYQTAYAERDHHGVPELIGKIYKSTDIVKIPFDDIKSINMMVLTSCGGFEKAQKQRSTHSKHFDNDVSTSFNSNIDKI